MTLYLAPEYRPRPRIAVAAWMLALHSAAGPSLRREQWLVELLSCAMYGSRTVSS